MVPISESPFDAKRWIKKTLYPHRLYPPFVFVFVLGSLTFFFSATCALFFFFSLVLSLIPLTFQPLIILARFRSHLYSVVTRHVYDSPHLLRVFSLSTRTLTLAPPYTGRHSGSTPSLSSPNSQPHDSLHAQRRNAVLFLPESFERTGKDAYDPLRVPTSFFRAFGC